MLEGGWHFVTPSNASKPSQPASAHSFDSFPKSTQDHLFGSSYLSEVYRKADPQYNARFTVPVLWDKKTNTIVSNESAEILHDMGSAFDSALPAGDKKDLDIYPKDLRGEIDEMSQWIYDSINNGVYKSGFASKQEAYSENVTAVFKGLERVEEILSDGREYLIGGRLTETDIR